MQVMPEGPLSAAGAHDQADRDTEIMPYQSVHDQAAVSARSAEPGGIIVQYFIGTVGMKPLFRTVKPFS